ncbi:CsgG/HfaB family protein [Pararhizobium haloflavum]|uniref:CsgG/HfaB family protein n=1 Tax=Pararhizobium haloflavum TaxID=2037914 RepID=UPI000C1944BA|nr:CsgG/HfaB family protein [Pararhizobium haloflavum]
MADHSVGVTKSLLAAVLGAMMLAGCAVTQETFLDSPPAVAAVTRPNDALRRLPAPVEKTVVAVYEYNDLTGQYRERENVQTLSRAVTQGGAPMLVKALQDAGEGRWFTVLERSELDNLLRERQILTEMRRIYRNEQRIDASILPPLMHAGIIIEGGIIGYDTNTITGGAGARFLGIGGDTKYVQDTVTVTLRAVSTKSGEVLATVSTRKAVASYALQGGAFRYLKLDELLEAEAGVTYNEPKQIAVESAIEAAVQSLIVEGAELGIWQFADKRLGQDYVTAYRARKYDERLTLAAQTRPAPATAAPTQIAETTGLAPRPVRVQTIRSPRAASAPAERRAAPAQTAPQAQPASPARRDLPPAPEGEGETLGSAPNDAAEEKPRDVASVEG